MSRVLTVSSGAVTPMWRRDGRGILEMVEPDGGEYATPMKGSRGRIELSGISDTFEMESQYSDTPVTKVRVEYRMLKPGNNSARQVEGKRFTEIMTWTMGPKSTLGKMIGTLRGSPVAAGEAINVDDFIGTTFVCTTTTSDDGKWGKVNPDSIEPDSIQLYGGRAVAAAATPDPDDDPFADDL